MYVDLNDRKHGHVYPRVCVILLLTRIWIKETYVVLLNYLNLFVLLLIMVIVTLPIEILSIEEKNYDWQLNIYRKKKKEKIKSSSQEQLIVLWSISIDRFPLNQCISSDVHLDNIYIYIQRIITPIFLPYYVDIAHTLQLYSRLYTRARRGREIISN